MGIIAGLSVAVLVLTALVVSIKTFALWHRTRALPELLLATYLTCATVLGYPVSIASSQLPRSEMFILHLGSHVLMSIGFSCLLLFTLEVFRPAALWAKGLVGLCIVLFTATGVMQIRDLTGDNPRPLTEMLDLSLMTTAPILITYLWTTIESLTYHRRLKLRLRLGLADLAVVNRVLLWGLMTFSAGTAVVVSLIGIISGSFMTMAFVVAYSCLGMVHACCLFFAFHPPGWYSAWLQRRAAVEAS